MFSKCVCRVVIKKVSIQVSERTPEEKLIQKFPMKESFEASGRHKRFDYLWSQNGLRMSQISRFQLTLRKTDFERQLHTSSCVVALDFFSFYFTKHLHMRSDYL